MFSVQLADKFLGRDLKALSTALSWKLAHILPEEFDFVFTVVSWYQNYDFEFDMVVKFLGWYPKALNIILPDFLSYPRYLCLFFKLFVLTKIIILNLLTSMNIGHRNGN